MKSTFYDQYYEMLSEYTKQKIEPYLDGEETFKLHSQNRTLEESIGYLDVDIPFQKMIEGNLDKRFKEPIEHPMYWQELRLIAINLMVIKLNASFG